MLTKRKRAKSLKATQFISLKNVPYYDEIVAKMKQGQPCSQIAAWIQTIKGDFVDKKRSAIQKQLERMRRQVAPKDVVDKALIEAKEKEMTEMVSIVKEADYLLKLNKKRIKRNEDTEKTSPISLQNQDRAIQLQIDLIDINKQILQDLGLLTSNATNPDGGVTNLNVNVNLSEEELKEKEDEVVRNIQDKLRRIESLRKSIGTPGKDGGEGVPAK